MVTKVIITFSEKPPRSIAMMEGFTSSTAIQLNALHKRYGALRVFIITCRHFCYVAGALYSAKD